MRAAIVLACLLLAGCASKPQQTAQQLDMRDPKFNSAACLDIRARALSYDDKVGQRMGIGFVSGLLLGPFGLPIAAAVDAEQDKERKAFNREIALRCMSNPPAELVG